MTRPTVVVVVAFIVCAVDVLLPSTSLPVGILSMSALFNFQSLLLVILLLICTCTYVRSVAPGIVDRNKQGFLGLFWMSARIGERLSPYVAMACVTMAVTLLVQ
ncbi:uncharacterized protein BXZ73DRAFT_99227 [Epithele typhae]|uniref:uncharacterized protein n=1 Tax=Epithele typhae TaxID=378194 RepID=UPI002007A976|nr:uncharacterized protein BXZ73DRAFT_99227 [Epithele typhae]KAH9939611.1 hypothetical protein BXZ73DRAFT_99227 [Epithele typhae]